MAEGKRQRFYTVEEKLDAIDGVNSGETQTKVSKDIGIAESTLQGWLKNESKLNGFVQNIDSAAGLKRKHVCYSAKPTIDKAMCTWFAQGRQKGMSLSGPILQAQATKFGNLTGDESFQASKGFIKRQSADESAANVFPAELKSILQNEDYHEEQLYNCDETALFGKLLPDKTLAFNYERQKTAGFKKIKDHVSLLFCSNKTGSHKLTPLLIGRFHNPRCFNHLNRAKLKNAWMTRHIFDNWFHNGFVPAFRKHLRSKKLKAKVLLLLDNCPVHPLAESLVSSDGKIRFLYLPFNTTSKIQPLDQDIIQNFKNNYRRELILAIVSCTSSGISEFMKQLNMKEIIYLIKKAWDGIKQKSIENCWMKALDFSLDTSPEIITEWLEMDENYPTSEFLSEEEILTGCEATSDCESDGENSNNAGLNDSDDDEEDVVEQVKISPTEVLSAVETVVRFMEEQNAENIELIHLRRMTDFIRKKENESMKEQKITEFFSK
uniref:HTH psq-type domain-containing protein n=1 Tax=Chrysemys picta bellii TaxID=8478 RepID=A0A8C3FUG2_CHRPI